MRISRAVTVGVAGLAFAAALAFPPNPRRTTPPPGIDASAVAVGAKAPAFTLPKATGGTFVLADALKKGPVALVFYRGYW